MEKYSFWLWKKPGKLREFFFYFAVTLIFGCIMYVITGSENNKLSIIQTKQNYYVPSG